MQELGWWQVASKGNQLENVGSDKATSPRQNRPQQTTIEKYDPWSTEDKQPHTTDYTGAEESQPDVYEI